MGDSKFEVDVRSSNVFIGDVQKQTNNACNPLSSGSPRGLRDSIYLTDPKLDMEGIIQKQKWKVSGTCEWILKEPQFQAWLTADDTRLLLLTGAPGIGKTTLSLFLVDWLSGFEKHATPVIQAYYFCNYMQESRNTTVAILRGLLWQLLHPKNHLYSHVEDYYNWKRDDFSEDINALKHMLLTIIKNSTREIHLLIDALDVCNSDTRQGLLETLTGLLERCPNAKLKILITSRPERDTETLSCDKLNIQPSMIDADLREFIDVRINSLDIGSRLQTKLKDALCKKAGGTFLWAAHVIEEVRSIDLEEEDRAEKIERILEDIPSGLCDTYDWILRRISPTDEKKAQFVLRILTVARQPMNVKDLRIAYHIHTRGKPPRAEELEGPSNIPKICGSLVSVDGEVVSLMHQSVKDYLQSDALLWNYHGGNCRRVATLEPYILLTTVLAAELYSMDHLCLSRLGYAIFLILAALLCHVLASSFVCCTTSTSCTSWISTIGKHSWDHLHIYGHLVSNIISQFLGALGVLSSISRYHVVAESASLLYFRICVRYRCQIQNLGERPFLREWLDHALAADTLLSQDDFNRASLDKISHLRDMWLRKAASGGKAHTAQQLLSCGAQLESVDENGHTALSLAARSGHVSLVELLASGSGPEEIMYEDNWIHFSWPARFSLGAGRQIAHQAACIDTTDKDGATPLALAASNGHYPVVVYLSEHGGDLESRDDDGRTPLSRAAQGGYLEVVRFLVDQGAQVDSRDQEAQTPLSWAAENGQTEVVEYLFRQGAKLDVVDNYKHTPLSWATENGHKEVIQFLLDNEEKKKRSLLEAKNREGLTPLAAAVRRGHENIVRLLLSGHNTLLRSRDNHGLTALSWAARGGKESITKFLLAQDHVQLDSKDNHGLTPLAWAAHMGHASIVDILLQRGADPESPIRLVLERGQFLERAALKLIEADHPFCLFNSAMAMAWSLLTFHIQTVRLFTSSRAWSFRGSHRFILTLAKLSEHERTMTLIIERGATMEAGCKHDANSPSSNGLKRSRKLVQQLLTHGTKLGSTCKYDRLHSLWGREYQDMFTVEPCCESNAPLQSIRRLGGSFFDLCSFQENLACQLNGGTTLALINPISNMKTNHDRLLIAPSFGSDSPSLMMLPTDPNAHTLGRWKHQMLMFAVANDERALVRRLLRQSTPLDYEDAEIGPLALAAQKGLEDIVRLLIAKGANLELADPRGCTPLSLASEEGHNSIVSLLLAHGADVTTRNRYGRSPLSWAAQKGRSDVVTLLLDAGADLESKDLKYARTPLLWAMSGGHLAVVEQLLRRGAQWQVQDKDGKSAEDWAEKQWGREVVVRLQEIQS